MQVGELLQYKEHVLQVCQSEANACTHCFATVAPTLDKCREKRDLWLEESKQ